jgi:hypothetical protein
LHTADRMGSVDGGEALWKATEADAKAAGEPLSRILNRYDGARRLAGMVDEAEFAAAMFAYAKRNLTARGQLVRRERAKREEAQTGGGAFDSMAGEPTTSPGPAPTAPAPPVYLVPDEGGIAEPLVDPEDDPAQPTAFAFDPWAAR